MWGFLFCFVHDGRIISINFDSREMARESEGKDKNPI